MCKSTQKFITKREHKVIDVQRFTDDVAKLKANTNHDAAKLVTAESNLNNAMLEFRGVNELIKGQLPKLLAIREPMLRSVLVSVSAAKKRVFKRLLDIYAPCAEEIAGRFVSLPEILPRFEAQRLAADAIFNELTLFIQTQTAAPLASGTTTPPLYHASDASAQPQPNIRPTDPVIPESALPSYHTVDPVVASSQIQAVCSTNMGSAAVASAATSMSGMKISADNVKTASSYAPPPAAIAAGASAYGAYSQQQRVATTGRPPQPQQGFSVLGRMPPPPPPPTFSAPLARRRVVACFDFVAQQDDDLPFAKGDMIAIIEANGDRNSWWRGECNGRVGNFPANYTREMP